MIAPVKVPSTAPETGEEKKITANEERRLLNGLEKKWKSHCKRGLAVRHEMGGLLNQTLGSPTSRLPHGQAVLKKAAERLAISESELSRMRWLAHLFENVEALQSEHPYCKSWTSFKRELPRLKSAISGTAAPGTVRRTQPALRGVVNSINNLAVKFERLDANPATNRCKKLLDELKVAVKEAEDFLARQKTAASENGKAVESELAAIAAS